MKKIDWLWLAVFCLGVEIMMGIAGFFFKLDNGWKDLNQFTGYLVLAIFAVLCCLIQPNNKFCWQKEPQRFYGQQQAKKYCQVRQGQWLYVLMVGFFSLLAMLINRDIVFLSGLDAESVRSSFVAFVQRNWLLICFWLLSGIWLLSTVDDLHWIPSDRIDGECH